MPVPASMTTTRSAISTLKQVVLPPYRTVCGPGQGTEARTPQSFTFMLAAMALLPRRGLHPGLSCRPGPGGRLT